ncbi:MAG: hypothetical protein ACI3U2_10515 [Anaerovibrio sp.]
MFSALCVEATLQLLHHVFQNVMYFSPVLGWSVKRIIFFTNIFLTLGVIYYWGNNLAWQRRYIIALFLLVIMVAGKFHFSSMGFYDGMLLGNTVDYEQTTLLGVPRGIRGDEWATEKPYYFAQASSSIDFSYYNNNLMENGCDMVVSAFAPIKDVIILARPDLWGFFFLPSDYAFSSYWWIKIIFLFMSSLEFFYYISGRKQYAVLGSVLMTFSLPIQWWFSQQMVYMTISSQLAIVMLGRYFLEKKIYISLFYVSVFAWMVLIYIMSLYPAISVPLGYIMLTIMVSIYYENNICKYFSYKKVFGILFALLPVIAILWHFYNMSWEAINTILGTVYPGSHRGWAPIEWRYNLDVFVSAFCAFGVPDYSNQSELSRMFTFFPFVFIVMLFCIYKKIQMPISAVAVFIISTLLLFATHCSINENFRSITLLSMSIAKRTHYAVEFGYFYTLMILAVRLREWPELSKKNAVIVSAIICFILGGFMVCDNFIAGYFDSFSLYWPLLVLLLVYTCCGYMFLRIKTYGAINFLCAFAILTMACSFAVNPICSGVSSMFDKTTMQEIREINNDAPGRWMVTGHTTIANLVTAQGVKRTTGTYYYPDMKLMSMIDTNNEYKNIYNQYAHIDMELVDEPSNSMTIKGTDMWIRITYDTLKSLGVKYIFTNKDIPYKFIESRKVKLIYKDKIDPWCIYLVE